MYNPFVWGFKMSVEDSRTFVETSNVVAQTFPAPCLWDNSRSSDSDRFVRSGDLFHLEIQRFRAACGRFPGRQIFLVGRQWHRGKGGRHLRCWTERWYMLRPCYHILLLAPFVWNFVCLSLSLCVPYTQSCLCLSACLRFCIPFTSPGLVSSIPISSKWPPKWENLNHLSAMYLIPSP